MRIKIIKKLFDNMLKINKEYLLLFVVISALGLMIYSSIAVSESAQDITITTFYPAPFGEFREVSAKMYWDFDSPGIDFLNPAANDRFVDPSGLSVIQSLQVSSGIITSHVSGPPVFGPPRYNFDLTGLNPGDATLNEVRATRFIQGDPGPGGINAERGGGKYIYGASDISEGVIGKDCEPGDVVLISDDAKMDIIKSSVCFDSRVAGVVSEDPKIYMGSGEYKVPLALAGIVKCKATAENGSIERGDLLVTSSLSGHAMKAIPQEVKPGMLIGKAMQPLTERTGKIYILVNKK